MMAFEKPLNSMKTAVDRLHVFKGIVFKQQAPVASVINDAKLEVTDAHLKTQPVMMQVFYIKFGVFDLLNKVEIGNRGLQKQLFPVP